METIQVRGRNCHILHPNDGPWLYWLTQSGCEKDLLLLDQKIQQMVNKPYGLAALEAENWNREYSPWPAPAAFGKEDFPGEGEKTLCALQELAELTGKGQTRYVGGYSLAGLFALWAVYKSKYFDGVASCSGSLWYPGWQDWVETQTLPENCSVYLSLGKKEEHTRNRILARVGDATRKQYEVLCSDKHVDRTALVWHEGGHFNEPTQRMAQGFVWLLTRQ